MEKASAFLNRLSESATLAMSRKSRELKEKGIDVISLSLGEPDFNTPDFIKDAARAALDNNITKYPPVNGFKELREAICKKFKRDNGINYNPDQIVVSTGAKQSIANLILATIGKGDEVIIPAPFWVTYIEQVKMVEGIPVVIPTSIENDFKVTAEELEEKINNNTKLIMFSSPCNPSGSVYSKDELERISKVMERHPHVYVMCDEIYEHINFVGKHESLAAFDAIANRVITVNGVSKGFAMTGWRLGYIGAPEWIAKACAKIQGQVTSGANSITQMATIAAVSADPSVTHYMRDAFKKRRELVSSLLSEIPGVKINEPEGAFYHFPDVSAYFGKSDGNKTIENSFDLAEYILTEGHVAMVAGAAFGSPNNIRISYAASEDELREAMNRLKNTLAKLS